MVRDLRLDLDVYQGPFDLLFSLILREEVDILEVAVLDVILAYLEQQAEHGKADWESISEFLVLISSLLELKSRILLPQYEPNEEEISPREARERLFGHLVTYARFKNAAEALTARRHAEHNHRLRPAERKPERRLPALSRIRGAGDPEDLAAAMGALLSSRRTPDTSHLPRSVITVAQRITVVRSLLRSRGSLSFEGTFGGEEPLVQAVTLFAILELVEEDNIRAEQEERFGDIHVSSEEEQSIVQPSS